VRLCFVEFALDLNSKWISYPYVCFLKSRHVLIQFSGFIYIYIYIYVCVCVCVCACVCVLRFRFLWPWIVSKVWRERKQTRCNNQMFIITFCLNMFRASLCPSSGEQRQCVTAYGVLRWFCWMWLVAVVGRCVVGCEHCEVLLAPHNAAPHNLYQPHPAEPAQYTICSNTLSLFSWRWA